MTTAARAPAAASASYRAAAMNTRGGTYIVASGAILFGAIQFVRGLGEIVRD